MNTDARTKGTWTREPDEPTYNPEADAYQIAILQFPAGDNEIIPAFAFGKTKEICLANAYALCNGVNSHQLLLDALKASLQILEQTKIHRINANVTGGNIFLDATIEQAKQAIINAEK